MFLDLDGVRVYYEAEGTGRPVLLLHGWGANAGAMRPILSCLRADYAAYALDFPGFGQSAPPPAPWGVDDYSRLVLRFMDARSIARADLIGHSFGGRVAIKLAFGKPDRVGKLVLVDSAGIRPAPSVKQALARAILGIGKAALQAPGLGSLRARAERAARLRLGSEDYRAAGPLRETFVKVVSEDLRPFLPGIQAPALLIWGELDDATPVEDARIMEREIPDAGLVVLKGAGHFSYLDRPDEFARIVRTFLAQP